MENAFEFDADGLVDLWSEGADSSPAAATCCALSLGSTSSAGTASSCLGTLGSVGTFSSYGQC